MSSRPPGRSRPVSARRTPGSLRPPDVLGHADRADRVERAVVDVAVVLDADLDPVGEPGLGHPLAGQRGLLRRERDARRPRRRTAARRAAPGCPSRSRRRAAACPARRPSLRQTRSSLASCAASSPTCSSVPDGARVDHRRPEHQPVEVVADVVVVGDGGRVAPAAVPPAVPADAGPPPAGGGGCARARRAPAPVRSSASRSAHRRPPGLSRGPGDPSSSAP